MNAPKITVQNQNANIRTPEGAAIVKGQHYNLLRDDVETNETNLATTQAALDVSEAYVETKLPAAGGLVLSTGITQYTGTVTMSKAQIIDSGVGGFAHASGMALVAGVAGYVIELVSAVLIFDGDGTGYGAGGNVTINFSGGGAAITGVVSAANSFASTGDKIYRFVPLSTAALSLGVNTGINIVAASAFTTTATTATAIVRITYNMVATGL